MSDTISLVKPVPDSVLLTLSDYQKLFFLTVGFNFCFSLTCSSLMTLLVKYKEASSNE